MKTFIVMICLAASQMVVGLVARAGSIEQSVYFKNVTAQVLYDVYMSSEKHSAFTGLPAEIENRVGGSFKAFKGALAPGEYGVVGEFKKLDPGHVIVQTWRGAHDRIEEGTSTLVLLFADKVGGAEISLFQYDIPDRLLEIVKTSWGPRYWEPLQNYLAKNPSTDMVTANFGNHLKTTSNTKDRQSIQDFYVKALNCKMLKSPVAGLDLFRFTNNVYIGVYYSMENLSENAFMNSTWLEIKSNNSKVLKETILKSGGKEISYLDKSHFYFQAPGGQVYRVATENE